MRSLHRIPALRRLLLPLFARANPGDITIRHHFTRDPLRLHSFRHKGYWFHGRRREAASMALFRRLLRPGDTVIDVGGHIGYVSLYLAAVVGPSGHVWVFEPGPNNLPYIRQNAAQRSNIAVVEKGLGAACGKAVLFIEDLTGQNNSFVPEFDELRANQARSGVPTSVSQTEVEIVTLDGFIAEHRITPSFVKIDVEGSELAVLLGARALLSEQRPLLMVEVQSSRSDLQAIADEHEYDVLDEHLLPLRLESATVCRNTFWFHRTQHRALLEELRRST